ncbi:exodeoxyribonuclease III [Silicimonas algicola]|uniref:Exodeoxyribonuclease-3 n=1 Tax=Silicimonas algicola TaxID=1826607 RepID=A0A316GAK0_9RHOB|nr:exodeoxyribonuclease III [Silicimonas algicola]AZQ67941.1 exodeoxyribonuclease III [Silicimonas algicola]PWK57623.1 exodeoxyribonuclease-3 [Silicimonas algicola]
MKIATFNINNIRKRLPNLLAWLAEAEPDVVCLQELKTTDRQFPSSALEKAGYSSVWLGQSTWNGVAILSRDRAPVLVRYGLPGDLNDRQARYIEAAVDGVVICSLYAPNGNPQPGPKFDYKLAWNERLIAHAAELQATGVPVVLAGDFNIVPESCDVYPSRSYADNALVQAEPRRQYRSLLDAGWTDALRALYPEETLYTFWDYRRNRWQRNAGLRLDHVLLSGSMRERLVSGGIDRYVRGQDGASDHAPVWIDINRKKV